MNYDSNKYRVNLPLIKKLIEAEHTDEKRLKLISMIAVSTGVPIIVVCEFVKELFGDIPGLADKHARLIEFYTSKG